MPLEGTKSFVRSATRIDAPTEIEFDEIATLAKALCGVPQSIVMLRSEEHGWRPASGRSRLQDLAIVSGFCDYTAEHGELLVIEDTIHDPRAAEVAPVSGKLPIRFFVGVPFTSPSRSVMGILCLADIVPRDLTSDQKEALATLGSQLTRSMGLREQREALALVREKRKSSADHLRANEELFRTFMNASPFLSFIKNAEGCLLFYNWSYARHFGISDSDWLGRTDEQLWSRDLSLPPRAQDLKVMSSGSTVEVEERLRGSDGTITVWKTYRFPCYDSSGNLLLAGLAMDITEEKEQKKELERFQEEMQEANEQLRRLSVTDELTGLRNRRAFEERLMLEFSMSRRRRRELAVLLIDVDNFKKVNDCWGHAAGDAVLRRLSEVLQTTIRLPDLVARYGGEEFVVLLPESGVGAALGFARRLMERMEAEAWEHAPVTVSIGLAALTETLLNAFQLVNMADEALYAAKRAGKNRVAVHGDTAVELPELYGY